MWPGRKTLLYIVPKNNFTTTGLSSEQVSESRQKFGRNILNATQKNGFLLTVKEIVTEPMMVLLLSAATIYFISGKPGDGIFMVAAIIFQVAISLFQSTRSQNALEKLKAFSQPGCKAIRNGKTTEIPIEELVMGDCMVLEEGTSIPADGRIVQAHDFSVNESVMTGESLPVFKDDTQPEPFVYKGTTVNSGSAIAEVTAIGSQTRLGKIGLSLDGIEVEKTPLEAKIAGFVKQMALGGIVVFVIVWAINFGHSHQVLQSLLLSLTLAMSILPEEIPVAFTTFMALGAWRLMQSGIVVKQMKTVETLGSATVICTDKTGTLTENKMSLAQWYVCSSQTLSTPTGDTSDAEKELIRLAMWASEPMPYDPMEVALHEAYTKTTREDERPAYRIIHEYPLGGTPPMMTHIFENQAGKRIVAAKGAPEALLAVSVITDSEKQMVAQALHQMATKGYRVLGVGVAENPEFPFPKTQQEIKFCFKGLVAFFDPPRKNIPEVLQNFYRAGIEVKIITGDGTATTSTIAQNIGFHHYDKTIDGEALMQLNDRDLQHCVAQTFVFTRMFPEAKLRIINALKANHQIVAMTGDGVNDGPALKSAHIGIAMGKKGTEIAKQAASLILLEDDLSKMVEAIAMGRKIYANLKKAIQYIISIHIPIILTVFIPLAFGWIYPNIFSPIHIIFMEIIMGPTCSIIYENEPMEQNTMLQKPKSITATFFNWRELSISILQGLMITAGTLFVYQISVQNGHNQLVTRAMVFVTLITANICLTLVNRSFIFTIWQTMKYKNPMIWYITLATTGLLAAMLWIEPIARFFEFETPEPGFLALAALVGLTSVIWFEMVKAIRGKQSNHSTQTATI